ncbi:MAG: cupin domain-containing protein [Acidobacteriota bacterium]|nr:cupin domain-containing protein [Acidobacteriota bacterium]
MSIRGQFWLFTLALILFISASARAQEMGGQSAVRNVAEMKFGHLPPLPTCALGSVQSGNPLTGPSIIFAKVAPGCSIPWHWHTPNEHVMMVSGVARMEMKDGKPLTLRAGGFALMASQHVHQFRCERACQLYIYSDVAFDIHYVNGQGNEISPSEAMKAVRQTAATEMK